jgi:AbrB family looped-hinge helix DNA binding protein
MRTMVTERGQVSIPAAVRRTLGIEPLSSVEWVVEDGSARLIPIPRDPISALRGSGRPGAVRRLLLERRRDRRKEDRR